MVQYAVRNKPQAEYTASPEKYPQGRFKDKPCRRCGVTFAPKAPSHFYCGADCAVDGVTSAYLRRNYGISVDEYRAMLEHQKGRCALCDGEGFLMNPATHKVRLVVDHCHATGKVRGLLCHNCNRALGLFHDDTTALRKAIDYLEGATTIP